MIDPRGIRRKVTKVENEAGGTFVTLECGHRGQRASHFHYTTGSELFCFKCGKEASMKLHAEHINGRKR